MHQTRPQLPISAYVNHPIPMIAPPPYTFRGVDSFSYLLGTKAEGKVIAEHFISKYLNEPLSCPTGKQVYHVPSEGTRPILTFSSIKESASESHPEVKVSYREVALQIPMIITRPDNGSNYGDSFYLPVLFIDGPALADGEQYPVDSRHAASPIVIGRELYGLPKIPAAIDFQYSGIQLESATVQFYGENVIAVTGAVSEDSIEGDADRMLNGEERKALAEELFGKMSANKEWTVGVTDDDFNAEIDLVHAGVPKWLVGLRQFRNPDQFTDAAGRAVIESHYQIRSGDPRPMGNQVKIEFPSQLAGALQLKAKYEIGRSATNGFVYLDTTSTFGDPGLTVVRPAP